MKRKMKEMVLGAWCLVPGAKMVLGARCLVLGALCAVGLTLAAEAQQVEISGAYFHPAAADTTQTATDYSAYVITHAGDGAAALAHVKAEGEDAIAAEAKSKMTEAPKFKAVCGQYEITHSSVSRFELSGNAYLVIYYRPSGIASDVFVLGADSEYLSDVAELYFDSDSESSNGYNSGWQTLPTAPEPEISGVSAEGWLDLTVGDRVAKATETLVADPAWGAAATATVSIEGESSARTYTSASNDLWQTASLEPGRYSLAFRAGEVMYGANFWKTGADWVVFDGSNITENTAFEADKTYLILGTNTVADGKTLTVTDGAKFEYAADAGFKGGMLDMPKRYRKETVAGDLYKIVEAAKGSEDNPWDVGGDASQPENIVEAYTNGNELVIVGKGTITDLSEIPVGIRDGLGAITIAEATVTGAAAGVFDGSVGIALTLPDNWQGDLPDERDTWYGALAVELTGWPMAVRNVKPQQRYPWNGLVDVTFDLTGEGSVAVTPTVTTNGVAIANPTVTGDLTADLGGGSELKDLRLTWDAKADFGDEGVHEKIKVKLSVSPVEQE